MASSLTSPCSANYQDPNSVSLNAKILKPLDDALRCQICFEYFTSCMVTKCSHNYCSLCIRRHMAYKSQCPTCFQAATEPELQSNRLIDEVLRIYRKIRESLNIPDETLEDLFSVLPGSSKVKVEHDKTEPAELDRFACVENIQSRTKMAASTSDEVSCPVCYKSISSYRINIHLDSCLKQTEEKNERKYLPKLVYHLLSDKQIRRKLKDEGLSSSGDRQALIKRHKNYILLYNANCDSLNPKPVSELVLEIERQELEERLNAPERNPPINKRSEQTEIERENQSYARENQYHFHALVRDIQEREIARIKKEEDSEVFMTSDMGKKFADKSKKKIGETSLHIGSTSNTETIKIKQENLESPPSTDKCSSDTSASDDNETPVKDKKSGPKRDVSNKPLPFRIRKVVPVKLKEKSPSLLEMSDDDSTTDSLSSLEDFSTSKKQTRSYLKKKNVRKLSVGDGNSQRKK